MAATRCTRRPRRAGRTGGAPRLSSGASHRPARHPPRDRTAPAGRLVGTRAATAAGRHRCGAHHHSHPPPRPRPPNIGRATRLWHWKMGRGRARQAAGRAGHPPPPSPCVVPVGSGLAGRQAHPPPPRRLAANSPCPPPAAANRRSVPNAGRTRAPTRRALCVFLTSFLTAPRRGGYQWGGAGTAAAAHLVSQRGRRGRKRAPSRGEAVGGGRPPKWTRRPRTGQLTRRGGPEGGAGGGWRRPPRWRRPPCQPDGGPAPWPGGGAARRAAHTQIVAARARGPAGIYRRPATARARWPLSPPVSTGAQRPAAAGGAVGGFPPLGLGSGGRSSPASRWRGGGGGVGLERTPRATPPLLAGAPSPV